MSQLHLILESVRVERAETAAEAARRGLGFDRLDRPLRAEVIIRQLPLRHLNGTARLLG